MLTFIKALLLRAVGAPLTGLNGLYRRHPALWLLMARTYRPWLDRLARLHAWLTCQSAAIAIPAGDLLRQRELHRTVTGYATLAFPSRRGFVINAHAKSAWATGITIALARVAMVTNTGPDLAKIIDTLYHFGPGFDYVIAAHPPFVKHLRDALDAQRFPWQRYHLRALVGGEGMTEALRDYLELRFAKVRSVYGVGELTIGIAGEFDFTVWLRRRLRVDARLRRDLLGPGERRLPMIFHYNPLETYLETTAGREILCTVNNTGPLAPKARYHTGDEGRLMSIRSVFRAVATDPAARAEAATVWRRDRVRLPLLTLFGGKDSALTYGGGTFSPQDVEYGLYRGNAVAHQIESFCVSVRGRAASRLVINLQLRDGVRLTDAERQRLALHCQHGVRDHLAEVTRGCADSLAEMLSATDPCVRVHDFGTGHFARPHDSITNVHVAPA